MGSFLGVGGACWGAGPLFFVPPCPWFARMRNPHAIKRSGHLEQGHLEQTVGRNWLRPKRRHRLTNRKPP